jgi:putative ABC transport system permease protein
METLLTDLRYGARALYKRPGFAAVAIITMALGIGANTAIFTVVNALLLTPPALPQPDRLVSVWGTTPTIPREEASLPDLVDWRAQSTSFATLSGVALTSVNLTGDGDPERVIGARVTGDFLATVGLAPVAGRDFTPEEDRPKAEHVVILSNGLWQRRYGGDPDAVGKTIVINGTPHAIVGVVPASFKLPSLPRPDLIVPLAMDPAEAGRRSDFLFVLGRLKPGVTVEAAETEMKGIATRLAAQYPESNTDWTVQLVPLHELMVEKLRPALLILLGAVAFVLLIACANVANLMLARATTRHREIAIRAALGAGRWRIARQMLTESVLLALVGGVVGVVVAPWATDLLLLAVPGNPSSLAETSIDRWVILFAIGLSVATGLLFGLAPALQVSKVGAGEALKDGGRGTAGDSRRRLRGALVASQVGLALVLLVGVGLMVRSFENLQGVELGFDPDHVLTARVTLPKVPYDSDERIAGFYDQLRERVAAVPGVRSVGLVNALPILGGGPFLSFEENGVPEPPPGDTPDANVRVVAPTYLETMRIPMRSGRALAETDRAGAPNALVINETMAQRYWPGQSPIGKQISFENRDGKPVFREIVGVVADIHHEGADSPEVPAAYIPYAQRPSSSLALVARTDGDPAKAAEAVRAAVREIDPNLPVYGVRTMEDALGESLAPRRYGMLLLGLFGLVALVLAAIGIYGVMSYLVAQRTNEIGIRMALGAERRSVLGLVLRQGMLMAVAGVAAGVVVAYGVSRLISSQLYEVSPADPWAFAVATGVLVAVAVVACLVPARRATKVDPMVALHYE